MVPILKHPTRSKKSIEVEEVPTEEDSGRDVTVTPHSVLEIKFSNIWRLRSFRPREHSA